MVKNRGIDKLSMMMVFFITAIINSGCAAVSYRDRPNFYCSVCKKKMIHIMEKDKQGKIHCKTCGSEISKTAKEHYCTNCGTRVEDFSIKVPF